MQDASLSYKVITIRSIEEQEGLVTRVEDQGTGATVYDDIFEAFLSTKSKGIEIGLAISKLIIEAHDGRLWGSRGATTLVACCRASYRTPGRKTVMKDATIIYLLDDDIRIRESLTSLVERCFVAGPSMTTFGYCADEHVENSAKQ